MAVTQTGIGSNGRTAISRSPFVVFVTIALAIVLVDGLNGAPFYADIDDRVRLLQIRELLQHGNFFDLTLGFVATPDQVVSHYSRLVDLPYVAIALMGVPFLGGEASLTFASLIWPPLMLVAFAWLAIHIVRRTYGDVLQPGCLIAMAALMTFSILEFSPGRVDHHNVQLLLMMAVVAGLVSESRWGGWWSGIAAASSIGVGLECLPYLAAAFGVLTLLAVRYPQRYRAKLALSGSGLAVGIMPMAYLSAGWGGIAAPHCDAIGAPWTAAVVSGGVILALIPVLWSSRLAAESGRAATFRFASLAIPSAVAVTVTAYLFPECLSGHYGGVDNLSRELWLDRLRQEKSVLRVLSEAPAGGGIATEALSVAFLVCLYGAVILASVPSRLRAARRGDFNGIFILAVAAISLVLFFVMLRSSRFMVAFAPLLVPAVLELRNSSTRRNDGQSAAARKWVLASIGAPVATIAALMTFTSKTETDLSVFEYMMVEECRQEDMAALMRVNSGRVLAGHKLSIRIAEDHPQHQVAAIPFHRASDGTGTFFRTMMASELTTRSDELAPFDYLAVCGRDLGLADAVRAPLFHTLISGDPVAGLVPVDYQPGSKFRLYRIDHAAFR